MKTARRSTLSGESAAAEWLVSEIVGLARRCGADAESRARLAEIVRELAETTAEKKETHLKIRDAEQTAFLKKASRERPLDALAGTPRTFSDGKTTPLVFDEKNGALYFSRHYGQEIRTAGALAERIRRADTPVSENSEKIIAAALPFPLNEGQKAAVRKILSAPFSVVSGGPGTGKTTLLLRALLCIFSENPDAEVVLAAPTGKAAARMKEAIRAQAEEILSASDAFPRDALRKAAELVPATLHGVLRIRAGELRTRPAAAISADFVFADEASMIDQEMMRHLTGALSARSRLVLLGDKNQLDSVGAGHVYGAICASEFLRTARVELTESRRFSEQGALGRLARAVVSGSVADAESVLENPTDDARSREIFRFSSEKISPRSLDAALTEIFPEKLRRVPADAEPEEMLALLESVRVLTPFRGGDFGVKSLNARARRLFSGGVPESAAHYHGQPILVSRNSPQNRLSNGDAGIVLREKSTGTLCAYFRADDGATRRIPISFLPEHETAYAMSIHKAQGSEFSRLCVIFPSAAGTPEDFLSRQLLYTAITRFRERGDAPRFLLIFDRDALFSAIAREKPLASLLPARFDSFSASDSVELPVSRERERIRHA